MSLSPRAIALQGVGYGALLLAVQGFGQFALPPSVDTDGLASVHVLQRQTELHAMWRVPEALLRYELGEADFRAVSPYLAARSEEGGVVLAPRVVVPTVLGASQDVVVGTAITEHAVASEVPSLSVSLVASEVLILHRRIKT